MMRLYRTREIPGHRGTGISRMAAKREAALCAGFIFVLGVSGRGRRGL